MTKKKYKWDFEDLREKARAVNKAENDTSWEEKIKYELIRVDGECGEWTFTQDIWKAIGEAIRQEREALLKEIVEEVEQYSKKRLPLGTAINRSLWTDIEVGIDEALTEVSELIKKKI